MRFLSPIMNQLFISFNMVLFTAILVFPSLSAATNLEAGFQDDFHMANDLFSQGEYQKAITEYQTLINHYGFSSELLFNLANSHAQNGEIGAAIVSYRRALILAPGDPDIKANLTATLNHAGIYQEPATLIQTITKLLTLNQWLILAIISLGILCISVFTAFFTFIPGAKRYPLASCFFLIIGVSGSMLSISSEKEAVVVANDQSLLVAPYPSSTIISSIQAGRQVDIIEQYRDYYKIVDENDKIGWLPQTSVEPVIIQTTADE